MDDKNIIIQNWANIHWIWFLWVVQMGYLPRRPLAFRGQISHLHHSSESYQCIFAQFWMIIYNICQLTLSSWHNIMSCLFLHHMKNICVRYEVSVIKPVDRKTVHRWRRQRRRHTTDNSWLLSANEPIKYTPRKSTGQPGLVDDNFH